MNVDVKAIANALRGNLTINSERLASVEAQARSKALAWLKAKFPETDEQAFYTDYTGRVHDEIIDLWAVAKAVDIDAHCSPCNGKCSLPEALKHSRPVVSISESLRGFNYLNIGWTTDAKCRFHPITSTMFMHSGLPPSYRSMTFKAYECSASTPEARKAKAEALNASEKGTCLILSGKPGTGKTHLAAAIALRAMEHGKQAIFRLVSAMLDEIQAAINGNGDYTGLMRRFKTVPCLVLDDLGHENMTPARASYLHQIIDYRYCENLQTIVTTNARTPDELCNLSGRDFAGPIISRLLGHGSWVTIEHAKDRRLQHAG